MQENNKIELSRLDRERREDFLEMLKGYVTSQVLFQMSKHFLCANDRSYKTFLGVYYMTLLCIVLSD